MPFLKKDSIDFYIFNTLNVVGIKHAIFTRRNGVSPSPWSSLNFGATVGDDPERVSENYRRAFKALDCKPESMYDAWQVHGTNVVFVEEPRCGAQHLKADILLTNRPGITLFMRFADCVPILLYDPQKRVIAIAHAGWSGTLNGVAGIAARAMIDHYGTNPSHIIAAIGPSIGPDVYEVGQDVINAARNSSCYPASTCDKAIKTRNNATYMDLWLLNKYNLEVNGVRDIEVASICTASNLKDWFSHRGEGGKTGRFGVLFSFD